MKTTPLAPIPAPKRSSFGTVRVGNHIYLAGGHTSVFHTYSPASIFATEFHRYDIQSDKWSQLCPLPFGLQGFRLVAGKDALFAIGGFRHCPIFDYTARSSDLVLRYSIPKDTWEVLSAVAPQRRSSYVCGVVDGRIYLLGGWDGTPAYPKDRAGRFFRTVEIFDLAASDFVTSLSILPVPARRALSAVTVDRSIIFAGGLGEEGFQRSDLFSDVIVFTPSTTGDPKTDSWEHLPNLPSSLFSPGIGALGKRLFLAGGTATMLSPSVGTCSAKIHYLDPGAERWEDTGCELSTGRSFVEVVPLTDSVIGLLGGHNGYETDSLPSDEFLALDTMA